jgi:hypothetical protein
LRSGIGVREFWELTPRETLLAIEAAIWRDERQQEQDIALAWRTAALTRTKKLPTLRSLLASSKPPKKLSGTELEKRRDEFKKMTQALKNVQIAGGKLIVRQKDGDNE